MESHTPNSWPRFSTTLAERQVGALSEVGRTMVSDADYEQVLAALIEKVGRILDAESGGFMLYDEAAGELQLQRPAFGFNSDELIKAYRVPLSGGGNAVTVFLTGQPYFSNDAPNDPRVLQRFVKLYQAQRIVSVPLQVEGRSIGVFHAINKRSGDFTVADVELLQLIAPQLAVIIQSAGMLRTLRSHEAELERLIHIHNNLTEMAIGGHDLIDLVDRLAELIQAEVVVSEVGGQVIAAPDRRRTASPELVSLLRRLTSRGEGDYGPAEVSVGDDHAIGVPIVAAGEVLGGVVSVGRRRSSGSAIVRTLQQSALVLALAIVKTREVADVERRLRADALEHLFVAESPAEEAALIRRLGFEPGEALRIARMLVAGFGLAAGSVPDRLHADQTGLHRLLTLLLARAWPQAVPVIRGESVVLVLPEAQMSYARLRERLERVFDVVASALRGGLQLRLIAVGSSARCAADVRRSLADADMVLAASRLLSEPKVVFVEDLGLLRLLAQPAEADDVRRFVSDVLGPLEVDPDAGAIRDWMPFLEALVASNFSVKNAAHGLGIHLSTARYRARRIEERLGIDFDDAEARLNVMVALRLRRVRLGQAAVGSTAAQ